ncbi:MAG: alpha/beta fold hydrolase [Anaerolineae bacterium]|nr:alpha/beta fold hydrolase [Anaerolineae bacterium]
MTTDSLNQIHSLEDGRRLGFAECGDPQGTPIFYFHASGSSRLERPADESILIELGVRFITVDRPGHGLSDPQPERKLLDWPDDVSQLADHLGVERFHVMGWSAGGAPALACAAKLPERVRTAALVSSVSPPDCPGQLRGLPFANRLWKFGARRMPALVRTLRRAAYPIIMGDPEEAGRTMSMSFALEDRRLLDDPEAMKRFVEDIQEGYRQGWEGPVHDDVVNARPWGFRLEDVAQRVDIWHGELDGNVRLHHADCLHERLPNSRLTVWEGEAHLALLIHWSEVLAVLIEDQVRE